MGILYITEYSAVGIIGTQALTTPIEPGTDQAPITYAASVASAAFANNTVLVRIHTDSICSVVFGTAPVATTSKRRMAAGQTEYFCVPPGASYKVAAITNT